MEIKKFIERMNDMKKELENESEFSSREKEILFDNLARSYLSNETPRESKKIEVVNPDDSIEDFDSFTTLINKTKINQHNDYVLEAIYYLMIIKGYESVNVKDVSEEYKKAYLKQTNIGVYLVNLTKRGLLMSVGKKEGSGAFAITREGIKYVREILKNGEQ